MGNLNIDEILVLMEELIDNSSAVPFSSKKMIDCDQMRDYIDNLRLNLPSEIEKAKETQAQKDNIIAEANAEAEKIIHKAEDDAAEIERKSEEGLEAARNKALELVSETVITQQAKDYAMELIQQARDEADGIVSAANADSERIINEAKENDKRIRRAMTDSVNKALSDALAALETSRDNINESVDRVTETMNAIESLNNVDEDSEPTEEEKPAEEPEPRRKFKFR